MESRHPMPPTVNYVLADAILKPSDIAAHNFKQHSVSTINSALVFNGKASQVIQGVSWIKMHPDLKQSHVYKTCKEQQCVSDIWVVAPANLFLISSEMGPKLFQAT